MIRHLVAMLSAATLVLAMAPVASAGAGWYLMVPSDAQMMADGSVVKGVTVAQYPQAASFDTAAACESTRDARGSKALAASQLAERQLEAANAARYSYAPYDEQGRLKDPKRDRELAEAQRKAGVAYFEAGIWLAKMQCSVCMASDDPRTTDPMKALVLALALASMVALPGAAISQTNQELLREIHGLREDLRSRLLDQELSQDMRDLRQQQRVDAREREGQERHQRELERRIRGGLGPFPCCEPD